MTRHYLHCPGFATVEEAIDWLAARGCGAQIRLYRGVDGLIRGGGWAL